MCFLLKPLQLIGKDQKYLCSNRTSQSPLSMHSFYAQENWNWRIRESPDSSGQKGPHVSSLVSQTSKIGHCPTSWATCAPFHRPQDVGGGLCCQEHCKPMVSSLSTKWLRSFSAELLPSQSILACVVATGSSFPESEWTSNWTSGSITFSIVLQEKICMCIGKK